MLQVQRTAVDAVHEAASPADLWPSVQAAIELEHATIPPYLTALFSIKVGQNREAAEIIGSVVGEEMLHMAIACNLMNALGGHPVIADPRFIPAYPGPLPMGVHASLVVGLEKLSRRLVREVFMVIEEPEAPIDIPVEPVAVLAAAELDAVTLVPPEFATIGEFYAAIKAKLQELPEPITGDPARQVVDPRWYPADELFAILTVDDALRAIDVIVEQGEGTTLTPLDASGAPSHYYRFGELVSGRRLVSSDQPPGWAYAGAAVPLDPAGIWDLSRDMKAADYPAQSRARVLADAFNESYSHLLRCLHAVFNGQPEQLAMALSAMIEMKLCAQRLVAVPVPGTALYAGPTFEYTYA